MVWLAGRLSRRHSYMVCVKEEKKQPSGDFGDVAQIKNCCGVTLLRINNSVCAYNYHRRKKAELEIFPPQAHLGKHHAVKTTANSPWRWSVRHLCGTWAEGGLPLAENAEEQDGGACCWQDGHAEQKWPVPKDNEQRTALSLWSTRVVFPLS